MTAHVLAMALLGAAAAQPTYFTFQQFNTNDDSCGSADSTATTTIWAYNTCSLTKDGKESTKIIEDDNNVTITTYPNKGCNGTGVVRTCFACSSRFGHLAGFYAVCFVQETNKCA